LGAYENQDLPFEKLVDELRLERTMSRSPVFQVMFALQNAPPAEHAKLADLTMVPLLAESGTVKFDLSMIVEEGAGGLVVSLRYNTDLFNDSTIKRLLSGFEVLLSAVVGDAEQRISALPLLPEEERGALLCEWNETARELAAEECVQRLFEAQ